jgi:BirA family biotin operon repressor/biotin-[acetyl-CoA-carboxylase] ligase
MTTASAECWEGASAADIARRLRLPRVEVLADTTSTLDVAHELAESGAPAGTLVIAEAQRAGRGRMGRSWRSEPGRGVWCTMIERPSDARALDVLSIRVGLAIARGIDAIAGERVGVKWPNDLVVRAGKLGGILSEARWSGSTLGWVAVGVGVNVMTPADVPGAAGLRDGSSRADVLTAIVAAIRQAASRDGHFDALELKQFGERDILNGRRLTSPAIGVAEGISEAGALLVRTASGLEHHRTGTVQLAEGT